MKAITELRILEESGCQGASSAHRFKYQSPAIVSMPLASIIAGAGGSQIDQDLSSTQANEGGRPGRGSRKRGG